MSHNLLPIILVVLVVFSIMCLTATKSEPYTVVGKPYIISELKKTEELENKLRLAWQEAKDSEIADKLRQAWEEAKNRVRDLKAQKEGFINFADANAADSYSKPTRNPDDIELLTGTQFAPSGIHVEHNVMKDEVDIRPSYADIDTRIIMSGSGFAPEREILPAWGTRDDLNDKTYGGAYSMKYNLFSKGCCNKQWPVPFEYLVGQDKEIEKAFKQGKYVPNSYKGSNNWQDTGCLCMTPLQVQFIRGRGGNS